MNNFDLKKFLVENRVTTRGRLMFEREGANLVPLQSVGLFLDTEEKTLHPMKDDGTPDLDPGMAVDMQDANKEEIMAKIDDADKEVLVSVSKELSETLVDADQDMAEAILDALGGESAFEAVVRAMSTDDAQVYLGGIMRDHGIEMGTVNEALNKPLVQLGPAVEKRMKSSNFEVKIIPNQLRVPGDAIEAITQNSKYAAIAFGESDGREFMEVVVNKDRLKDLTKVRDYFNIPSGAYGPDKDMGWVVKNVRNVNAGDIIASKAELVGGIGKVTFFRAEKANDNSTGMLGTQSIKSTNKMAAEGNLEEATDLHSDRGYLFTRFNGGKEKGKMLQINTPDRQYIQIPQGNLGNFLVALEKAIKAFDQ